MINVLHKSHRRLVCSLISLLPAIRVRSCSPSIPHRFEDSLSRILLGEKDKAKDKRSEWLVIPITFCCDWGSENNSESWHCELGMGAVRRTLRKRIIHCPVKFAFSRRRIYFDPFTSTTTEVISNLNVEGSTDEIRLVTARTAVWHKTWIHLLIFTMNKVTRKKDLFRCSCLDTANNFRRMSSTSIGIVWLRLIALAERTGDQTRTRWIRLAVMGVVNTLWVLIVSTIPGLNVPKWTSVFCYLSGLQFIVYLLFLGLELLACSWQFEIGPKVLTCTRSENCDLRTSSQIDAASQRLMWLGNFSWDWAYRFGTAKLFLSPISAVDFLIKIRKDTFLTMTFRGVKATFVSSKSCFWLSFFLPFFIMRPKDPGLRCVFKLSFAPVPPFYPVVPWFACSRRYILRIVS